MRPFLVSAVLAAAIVAVPFARPAAAAGGPSCGETTYRGPKGIVFRVLFAKNGAVQRFAIVTSSNNPELDHDVQRSLVRQYGPEAVNAPPLTIVSFKPAPGGGMMVPDKAMDSCGRVLRFQ